MTKSPSRHAGYSSLMVDAVARDGLTCFLCGQIHTRADTMQVDFRTPLDSGGSADADNAIPVCKTCAKRRNQSPIGAYWRKRLIDAQRETAYIHQMAEDKELLDTLAATVRVGRGVPLRDVTGTQGPAGTSKSQETATRRVRQYDSERMNPEEVGVSGWPKSARHGDMYMNHNDGINYTYSDAHEQWLDAEYAQERDIIPAQWPPRDVEPWNA